MHLVNIKALERVREVVDAAVTERAIAEQFNTFDCRERLAHDLGYSLLTVKNGRFWCATALDRHVLAQAFDLLRTEGVAAAKEHMLSQLLALQALSLADAETAVLCALLDDDLELTTDERETAQLYSEVPRQTPVERLAPIIEPFLGTVDSLRRSSKCDKEGDWRVLLWLIELARSVAYGKSHAIFDIESRPLVEDEFPELDR